MAAPMPLHADRRDGRTHTADDRCRSGKTSTHGGLIDGHLKPHPNLHSLDGHNHHTLKHGWWLNMAEIELSALGRDLPDRVGGRATLERHVEAWRHRRNAA